MLLLALAVGFLVPRGAGAARLFTSGFETDNFIETEWSAVSVGGSGLAETQGAVVRSGNFALRLKKPTSGSTAQVRRPLTPAIGNGTTVFTRFYIRLSSDTSLSAGNDRIDLAALHNNSFNTAEHSLELDETTRGVRVMQENGGQLLFTSTDPLPLDQWVRVEWRVKLDDTSGEVELRFDGGVQGSASTIDTFRRVLNRFDLGNGTNFDDTVEYYFDDIAINDDNGTFQSSWAGPGKVVMLEPTFDDAVAWTANPSGSNAANVNDVPGTPDDDTTYNSVSDTTSEDRLYLSELPDDVPVGATLTLAHVFARAGGDGASARSIRLRWWNEDGTAITGPAFDTNVDGYRIGDTDELLVVDLSTSTRVDVSVSEIGYVANSGSSLLKKVTAVWANVEWSVGAAGGASVSSRSDTLSDSRPGTGSNHTITFTVNTAIDESETVEVTWPSGFLFSEDELNCGDVDVATGSEFVLSATSIGCEATATNWGVTFVTSSRTFILVAPTSSRVWVATGTQVTIEIGTNATSQFAGDTRITNPSLAGTYTVSVGGTFGGAGNMLVSIQSGLVVKAEVREHLTVAITGVPNWYDANWGFRKRIIVDSTSVSGTQGHVDYPMLFNSTRLDFRHTDNGGNVGSVTGWDFVFTEADGTTMLDHEIERYASTTGELVAWTRIPFLSTTSTNELFVYYGYAAAADQQNVASTWSTNYRGVWHLSETSGGSDAIKDSTSNDNHGTDVDSPTLGATGQLDGSIDFPGATDYVDVLDSTSLEFATSQNFTISAWVKSTQPGASAKWPVVVGKDPNAGTRQGYSLVLHNQALQNGKWYFNIFVGGSEFIVYGNNDVADGNWHYLVGLRSGSTLFTYEDGSSASSASASSGETGSDSDLHIGTIGAVSGNPPDNSCCTYNGLIDEVRVSSSTRPSAWILTEYNNQNSPNTFYTLGDEEAQAQTSCTADDGASVTVVNTTGVSVPFGTVAANAFYQGCQDVEVSTNAGGGYSATVQEQTPMRTGGDDAIPDTTCDSGTCTESTAGAWTNASNNGFGHTCRNQVNNDCDSAYSNGTDFRQFADISSGETAQEFMASSTRVNIAVGRVKFRLSVPASQGAGTYTNTIVYIVTPTF